VEERSKSKLRRKDGEMEGKSGKHVGGEKYSTESGGRTRCSEACSRILSMPDLCRVFENMELTWSSKH
jgi:hypothetical protein